MSEIKNANSGNFAAGLMNSLTKTAKSVEKQVVQVAKTAEKQITTGAKAAKDSVASGYSDVNVTKQKALAKFAETFPETKSCGAVKGGLGTLGGALNVISGITSIQNGKSLTDSETLKGVTNVFGGAVDIVDTGMEMKGLTAPAGLKVGGKLLGVAGAGFDAYAAGVAAYNGNEVAATESGLDALAGVANTAGPAGMAWGVPYSATRAVMKSTGGEEKMTNFFYQQTSGAIADGASSKLRQDELNKFAEFSNRGDLNQQVSINRRSAVAARVEAREMVKTATGGEKARLERLLKELNTGIAYATEREAEYKGLA